MSHLRDWMLKLNWTWYVDSICPTALRHNYRRKNWPNILDSSSPAWAILQPRISWPVARAHCHDADANISFAFWCFDIEVGWALNPNHRHCKTLAKGWTMDFGAIWHQYSCTEYMQLHRSWKLSTFWSRVKLCFDLDRLFNDASVWIFSFTPFEKVCVASLILGSIPYFVTAITRQLGKYLWQILPVVSNYFEHWRW